ncbi:MAG TPA: VOC family protein [Methylibium sp.]|uniref:VOC family protein n=1 Tax=Methylibium sp. TaxID=2067992 RepID=UPI002DB563DA|nr:VOC family protein [Methylibium sp.]HEU4459837.1 VOC family protein [Methylibium sp.]
MQVQSYLFFNGRCDEALEFYASKLGAKVEQRMSFADNPDLGAGEGCAGAMLPPGFEHKVMHASVRIGETVLLASDGMEPKAPEFKGIALALTVDDAAAAERCFSALAEGGQVQMPLGPSFFSPAFGCVADRFGVNWMVVAEAAQS